MMLAPVVKLPMVLLLMVVVPAVCIFQIPKKFEPRAVALARVTDPIVLFLMSEMPVEEVLIPEKIAPVAPFVKVIDPVPVTLPMVLAAVVPIFMSPS